MLKIFPLSEQVLLSNNEQLVKYEQLINKIIFALILSNNEQLVKYEQLINKINAKIIF